MNTIHSSSYKICRHPSPLLLFLAFLVGTLPSLQGMQSSGGDAETGIPEETGIPAHLDPTVRFELERALERQDYERAQHLLVHQIEQNPQAPKYELLVYLGGLFFVDEKYLNAAVAFKKAESLDGLDNGNRFTLAMAYVLLGRPDWARPELKKLEALEPANPLYSYWLARLDYDANDYASCVEKTEALVGKFPTYVRAWDRLGLCREALGENSAAVEAYERARTLNLENRTPSPWPPLNEGTLLLQMGEAARAEEVLREATEIDPDFAQGHYRLGLALEKLGRLPEAVASLRRAVEIDPEYPDPHWALARVLRLQGEREAARSAVERYRELKKSQENQTAPNPN